MRKIWAVLIILICCMGCQTAVNSLIEAKNACYNSRLESLRNRTLYKNVYSFFKSYFLKKKQKSKSLFHEMIDEAIFFSTDSTKCILIALQRSDRNVEEGGALFGSARTYEGTLVEKEWKFEESFWFTFDNGYFKKYSENSFENISKIARYTILSSGNADFGSCEIDEAFWFENE